MEYFALLIPIIGIIVCFKLFRTKMVWWEYIIPLVLVFFVIIGVKGCQQKIAVQDVEYWGSQIVEARYYEYWETWKVETCTRTYDCNCSTDSKGNKSCSTCTETYDCSHCEEHAAQWIAYDDKGKEYSITREHFNYLIKKWKHDASFIELNRDINFSHGCGKDGNMYSIRWDGTIETAESATTIHDYVNIVQASHSAFKLEHINDEDAKKLGLFNYPPITDEYKQRCVLGIDSLYTPREVEEIETYFQYFNGHYGPLNKVKVFVLIFYNKPLGIVNKQQAYWDGGNKNEFVVCISVDKQTREIQWTKCFSWTNEKRAAIDVREDIMEGPKQFNPMHIYNTVVKAVGDKDMHKSFRVDFGYLDIDIPTSTIVIIYILSAILTSISCLFAIKNNIDNKQTNNYDTRRPNQRDFQSRRRKY